MMCVTAVCDVTVTYLHIAEDASLCFTDASISAMASIFVLVLAVRLHSQTRSL